MRLKNRHFQLSERTKKIAALLVGFVGLYYFDCGISLLLQEMNKSQKVVAILPPQMQKIVPEKPSFEDYCRQNPVSTCWNEQKPDDFLYQQENVPVAILKTEEFAPELLDEPVDIEETYEEKLPEDIIEAKDVYTSKLYGKHIIPSRKPPYFAIPVIAVVIDDMGVSHKRTADIISLQAPLTASFLTYSRKLEEQIEQAQASGQEIMIHVPMEAKNNIDVAPDVLTSAMSEEEIGANLQVMLQKFNNVKGINNHMGSKLTEDKVRMSAIMQILKQHNLFFLDSKTSANSCAQEAAEERNVAYVQRNVFIDNNNDKVYILEQLKKAEKIAQDKGYAIAIGHPKSQTYEALKEWLPSLAAKNMKLIPLSQIVNELNRGLLRSSSNNL